MTIGITVEVNQTFVVGIQRTKRRKNIGKAEILYKQSYDVNLADSMPIADSRAKKAF